MSQLSSGFLNSPGMGAPVETYDRAVTWGRFELMRYWSAWIYSGALDPTNTPTTNLRSGLVMGIITSTGQWTNYSPTATDGSQVARGVLALALPMLDYFTNTGQNKFAPIYVAGGLKAANIIGLDLQARADLSPNFIFDDNLLGNYRFPTQQFVTKTASYQVLSTDNFVEFDNLGASGAVTFTLPAIANGYCFTFRARAAQNLIVASSEGANMEALNNLVANSVAFQTGSAIIGGVFKIYSNPAGTKWLVSTLSAGANTVTVA